MNDCFLELQVLKEDSFSRIVLCLDTRSGQKTIVKELLESAPQTLRQQMRTEVMLLGRLKGKGNIPSLYEACLEDLRPYLAEEFIDGLTMSQWLETKPSRAAKKAVFVEIADLLSLVHQQGYVYLDLKEDNVLIVQEHPWLIDFNACLPIGSRRPVLSNSRSLPPECEAGLPMDWRADQIGLGRLHQRMFRKSLISSIALHKNPEKRFASMEAFKKAVQGRSARFKAIAAVLVCMAIAAAGTAAYITRLNFAKPLEALPAHAEQIAKAAANGRLDPSVFTQESSYLQAVRLAIDEQHLPLAGYLLRISQADSSDAYAFCYGRVLLSLMLGLPVSYEQLCSLLEQTAAQADLEEHLGTLCDALTISGTLLAKEDFEQLAGHLEQAQRLDDAACESFAAYALLVQTQSDQPLLFPDSLEKRLEFRVPDAWQMLMAAREAAGKGRA